ncbi:MAG: AraC family transcriptional regulator [Saprospiraceae bacterium]|nr:AraC family transcriptional regulator [Saprospiraceae bacterium]MBK7220123.1 AraC family transcriptional regulator [Saprospiraceae bacterium]MBK8849374.1 AraC family transcriptional regulator [Saprospiraceae bacterium]
MIFEQFQLTSILKKHVESVLYFKGLNPNHSVERIVPTGHVFVVFELDNIPRNTYDNETLQPLETYTKVWVSGTHRNFISISAHQQSEMLAIQFKSSGAFPFLHCPLQDLNDKVVPAQEIFGSEVLELREKIFMAENPQAKFNLVSNWLESRFDSKKEAPEFLLTFIELLQKEPVSNLNRIMDSYPTTQKQLIQHFKKYVGLTPKYYHRILRFNEILKIINKNERLSWTEIAYSCDYSDQSHFIKEFTLFSGFNPLKFIKMDFPKERTNFFPLDPKG